jgi:hypothetical protein
VLYAKAKSDDEKAHDRLELELHYEAEFLTRTITALEARRDERRALSDKGTAERFRSSD